MDTRKLHIAGNGYIATENDGYLELDTPFTEGAFKDQHGNTEKTAADNAAEIVRRWNAYPEQQERIAKLEEALENIFNWSASRDGSAEQDEHAIHAIQDIASAALLETLKA